MAVADKAGLPGTFDALTLVLDFIISLLLCFRIPCKTRGYSTNECCPFLLGNKNSLFGRRPNVKKG